MKIALITTLFPPVWLAGTEIASYNIAKTLAKKGHDVHIITSLDEGFPRTEIQDHFCIHRICFKRIRFIGVISFWFQILLEIKKINPDIVQIQSILTGLPGFFSKILFKKPYVVWAQGSDVYLVGKFTTKLISKVVLKNASAVIALSEDMKRKMNSVCRREDIVILSNGIELDKFKDTYPRKQNNKTKKTIIFVGTLHAVKGIEYLIKAMNIIHEKLPDTNLLIVGDGTDREKLETLAQDLGLQDCIHFAGKVSNEEIPGYMEEADVFALPSLSESFGIVNIEAMASGLPIVATKVGGIPEIVIHGENGLLVEPRNPEILAEKILLILNDNELRRKLSENNLMKATNYSWDYVVNDLINIMDLNIK